MSSNNEISKDKIMVEIDSDLQDLIPGYMQNKQNEITSIAEALLADDFETIRIISHNMKGNGSAYGFEKITEIAKEMELAAKHALGSEISKGITDLQTYLSQIEIVYVED